eukprot:g30357.t1
MLGWQRSLSMENINPHSTAVGVASSKADQPKKPQSSSFLGRKVKPRVLNSVDTAAQDTVDRSLQAVEYWSTLKAHWRESRR